LGRARDEATRTLDQVRLEVAAAMEQENRLAAAAVSAVAADMVHKVLGRRVG
jgi:hypothetical protein